MTYEEYKKKRQERDSSSTFTAYERYKYNQKAPSAKSVLDDLNARVENWFNNNNTFMSDYKSRIEGRTGGYGDAYVSDAKSAFDLATNQKQTFDKELQDILSIAEEYKDFLSLDYRTMLSDSFRKAQKAQDDILKGYSADVDYWSQWKDEDTYKEWQDQQKQNEEWASVDIATERSKYDRDFKNLNEAKGWQERIESEEHRLSQAEYNMKLSGGIIDEEEAKSLEQLKADLRNSKAWLMSLTLGKGVDEFEKYLSDKNVYLTQAERYQKSVELASVADAPDFEYYAGKGIEQEAEYNKSGGSFGKDGNKIVAYQNHGAEYLINHAASGGGGNRDVTLATEMNEDEVKIYSYYYAKEGEKKANEYFDSIRKTLEGRLAGNIVDSAGDSDFAKIIFGAVAGLDSFRSGVSALLENDDYYVPSAVQMAGQQFREDLGGSNVKLPDWLGGASLGQATYDLLNTGANMAPSILASIGANLLLPGSGAVVGGTLMGASAGGNAYAEMINAGYTKEQAKTYGKLVAASESLLQYALGGVSALGGKLTGGAITNMLSKIDKAYQRVILSTIGKMASEGLEEGLQSVLEPWFKSVATNTDFEAADIDEVLYSGLLGALSAGFLDNVNIKDSNTIVGGTANLINNVANKYKSNVAVGKQISGVDGALDRLLELGSVQSADSVAYKVAEKINKRLADGKKVGAYTIAKLFNAEGAALTEANVADITKSLTRKGVTESDAKTISAWMAKAVEGVPLTEAQANALENNPLLDRTFQDVIINKNSTVYQRTKQMSDFVSDVSRGEMTQNKATTATPSTDTAKAVDTTESATTQEDATEGKFKASVDGKTVLTETAEEVKPVGIESIKNGSVKVKLEDGKVVDASELSFATSDEAVLYDMVSKMDISPESATALIKNFKATDGVSAERYAIDAPLAYKYGTINYAKGLENITDLTSAQRQTAYYIGQNAASVQVKAQQAAISSGEVVGGKGPTGRVRFEQGAYAKTREEKRAVKLAQYLSKAVGIDIVFYDATTKAEGENGYRANGYFNEKTNAIYLDLQKSHDDTKTIAFTMSHELTHFIKKWSPEKFKGFADFLMEQYGDTDITLESKMEQLGTKDADLAYEELIADACETMLLDSNAAVKLMQLRESDLDLFEKIKLHVLELLNKIRAAYKKLGLEATTDEAQALLKMEGVLEKLSAMFEDAAVDAAKNYQANAKPIPSDEIITDGAVVIDGNKKFSIKSMRHDIAEGQMFEDLKKYCGMSQTEVDKLKTQLNELVDYMNPFRDIVDLNETYGREGRKFSPYKPNSDPLYTISLDFSTQCSKRLLTQYVIEKLQLRENRPMSAEEQMAIRDMLKEYGKIEKGLQVAYVMCYVEAARLKAPKQIQKWLDDPATQMRNYFADKNPEFSAYIKKAQEDFKESRGYARNATKKDMSSKDVSALNKIRPKLRAEYTPSTEEAAVIEMVSKLPNSTYLTAGNLANLSETHPDVYKAYTSFIRTATRSKALETDEPYYYGDSRRDNGNGIVVSDSFIEDVNRENGMRFSSWSDWRIQHLLDWITAVIDNSVRGAAMHGYTKYGDEVRVLGKTGMMFNLSGVPGTQNGLNEDGTLNFSDTESIDYADAINLRKEFPETAGLQCIGVSKEHILALLRSEVIDYVIPYHTSGMNATLRRMGDIYGWKDFTQTQHATEDKSIKKENAEDPENFHVEPVFSEFFVGYKTDLGGVEAMRQSAENYIRMCKERGLVPKFLEFTNEPNYWKLLIDRKMVNTTTNTLVEQKAVRPEFDFGVIRGIVDQYVANYDGGLEERAFNHIVENWDNIPKRIRDLKKQGSTKAKKAIDTLANEPIAAQPVEEGIKKQMKKPSNRAILTDALEGVAQNDIEKNKLTQYKAKIDLLTAEEQKLQGLRAEIKELSFAKGPRDTKQIRELQDEATKTANRINNYDRQLLNLEATTALKNVLEREKARIRKAEAQKGKEALNAYRKKAETELRDTVLRYQESRHKAVEGRRKTEERHAIAKIAKDLDKLLNHGTKERNVKKGASDLVRSALDLANMYFASDDDIITSGIATQMTDAETKLIEKYTALYDEYHSYDDSVTANKVKRAELRSKMNAIRSELSDVLEREKKRINDTTASGIYDTLIKEYKKLSGAEESYLREAFNQDVVEYIEEMRKRVGNNLIGDMTLEQLKDLHRAFTMIKTLVQKSNKLFGEKNRATIAEQGESAMAEIEKQGHKATFSHTGKLASTMSFNNLKPIYLIERTKSKVLQERMQDILDGESIWAVDMEEGRAFMDEAKKKHGYDKWDFDKAYEFETETGLKYSLTLGEIFSIYAYSKRGEQALNHLRVDGFVFDKTKKIKNGKGFEVELNDSTSYAIDDKTRLSILGKLTAEQRAFIDETQKYLSEVMGEKGNEVSREMYGIDLFGEENYFPLRAEGAYLERAREQANGQVKYKNRGFTKATQEGARNSVVLSDYSKVWAEHVAEMSGYHAFTLALENFYKVYNYQNKSSTETNKKGVIPALNNAYGDGITKAIDQLLADLNGGARSDPRESPFKSGLSLFKKAKTMFSLSVIIQQPSSLLRAQAMIDAKYFVGFSKGKHKEMWNEIKKYAPVAVIKEMGRFDVGMGSSSAEWLLNDKNWREAVDDFLSRGASYADEAAWIKIWNAVKRETLHTEPKLKPNSEEFLKKAGQRFEDVVRHTQVYDSTLSRSGNMRSKSGLMQIVTAFLAEPTTSINMREMALRSGDKNRIIKTTVAVYASTLLNAVLVALPYAMRDDDEDETFIEKYATALTTSFVDSINPLTSLPFIKDIYSMLQGYDVKRSDMALADDLINSFEKFTSAVMDEEKDKKKITDSLLSLVGDLSSFTGLPVDNAIREVKSMVNFAKTLTKDFSDRDTTWLSFADALQNAFTKETPIVNWIFDEETKVDKLYDAIMAGDKAYADRIKGTYKTETSLETAMRKALREHDPRIKEAAEARIGGDIAEYTRIVKEITAEGKFVQDIVVGAINTEINAINKATKEESEEVEVDEATSIYRADDINAALDSGDIDLAKDIIAELIDVKVENGAEESKARSSVKSSITKHWKKLYKEAYAAKDTAEMRRIREILYATRLYGTATELVETVSGWLKEE